MKIDHKIGKAKLFAILLTSAYILLMLTAVIVSDVFHISSILIIVGCILNAIYMVKLRSGNYYFLIIIGMLCISLGAILVGIEQGNTQLSHHIIRTLFEGTVIFLFLK